MSDYGDVLRAWLYDGGEFPDDLRADDEFVTYVREQIQSRDILARLKSNLPRYRAGLEQLGISEYADVERRAEELARQNLEHLIESAGSDRFLCSLLRCVASLCMESEKPPDWLRFALQPASAAQLQNALLTGDLEPFRAVRAGNVIAQLLRLAPSDERAVNDGFDPLDLLGAATEAVVGGRPLTPLGSLLLGALVLRPRMKNDFDWETTLGRIGTDDEALASFLPSVAQGDFVFLHAVDHVVDVAGVLAATPELDEVLSRLGLRPDFAREKLRSALAAVESGEEELDPFCRLTWERLHRTNDEGRDARALIEGLARSNGIEPDWEDPAWIGRAELWARGEHARRWLARPDAPEVHAIVDSELAALAAEAEAGGIVRLQLLWTRLRYGADAAEVAARQLDIDDSAIDAVLEEYVTRADVPADDASAWSAARVRNALRLARGQPPGPALAWPDLGPRLVSRIEFELRERSARAGIDDWLVSVVIEHLGSGDGAGEVDDTFVDRVLECDARCWQDLDLGARLRLLREAGGRGIRTPPLAPLVDERRNQLLEEWREAGGDPGEVEPLLNDCRAHMVEGAAMPAGEASLVESFLNKELQGFRRFRTTEKQPPPRPPEPHRWITVQGLATFVIWACLVWLVWTYGPAAANKAWNVVAAGEEKAPPAEPRPSLGFLGADGRPREPGLSPVIGSERPTWIAVGPVTASQLGLLREDVDPRAGDEVVRVNALEARTWCEDHRAHLASKYPDEFVSGGRLAGYTVRLPTREELEQQGAGNGTAPLASEWLAVSANGPDTLGDSCPVYEGRDRQRTQPMVTRLPFRFVIAPGGER